MHPIFLSQSTNFCNVLLSMVIIQLCCAGLHCSVMSDSVIPWTAAHQASLSMGILQARILEWVAMPSSRRSSQPSDQIQVSCIAGRFFTVRTNREAQEYWSGPIPSSGDFPDPGIELGSPALQADSLPVELPGKSIIQLGHHNYDMNLEDLVTKCDGCIISISWHL